MALPLAVDAYVAAGRDVGFPRPSCPSCAGPLVFWSGYRRYVREAGRCRKIFVPRLPCGASHAMLPAFTLAWRLDMAETVGVVVTQVAGGACGVAVLARDAQALPLMPWTGRPPDRFDPDGRIHGVSAETSCVPFHKPLPRKRPLMLLRHEVALCE